MLRSLFALLFLPSFAFPAAAAAIQTSEDEIAVTATRRAQRTLDVPASVSVISGALAKDAATLNGAEDVTRYLAGVDAAVANGSQIAFQIRGIGAVDHQALTPTAAAVYADGVFLATNVQTSLFLYDLDRAEVLKGPQGTLYGRNASSGAINFLTVRPSQDQTSYLRASYGRFGRADVAGAFGAALSSRLSGRIAGRYLSEDAALDNVQSNPAIARGPKAAGGKRDEFGLRASLLYEFDSEAALLLRGHYEEDNGVNATPLNDSLDLGKHEISSEGDGVQNTNNDFFGAALEGEAQWGRWSVYSLSAVEGYNQNYGFDFDGSPAPFGNPNLGANLHYNRDFLQASEELRAQAEIGRATILIGAHGAWEDFSQDYLIWCGKLDAQTLAGSCPYVGAAGRVGPSPASPVTPMSLLTHIEQTRATAAFFTYNDIALTQRLTLTLGGRYTYERIEGEGYGLHIFDDGLRGFNNRDGLGAAIGENSIDEGRLTGNAALRYAPGDKTSVYVSFANGYKSGGFNGEVQNNATHWQDEGLFAAETVNAWELGFKTNPQETFALNAALFFQDYHDPQARIFVDFPLPDGGRITSNSLSNLDKAVSYGFDGDARLSPVHGLDLTAGFTWLETEIRQKSGNAGNAALFDGNPLPFAPEFSGTFAARYEWRVADRMRAAVQAGAKAKTAFYLDAEGLSQRRQGAYATIDAAAALYLDASGVELGLWGRNLSNQDAAIAGYGFIGYNTFRSAPRSYGVSAQVSF